MMNRYILPALLTLFGLHSAASADAVTLEIDSLTTPGVLWAPVLRDTEVIGAINREGDKLYLQLYYSWFELPKALAADFLHRYKDERHIVRCWFNVKTQALELTVRAVPAGSVHVEYKERARPEAGYVFLDGDAKQVEPEASDIPTHVLYRVPERTLKALHTFYPKDELKIIEPVKTTDSDGRAMTRRIWTLAAIVAVYLIVDFWIRRHSVCR